MSAADATPGPSPLTLTWAGKPLTANQARRLHHYALADKIRDLHDSGFWLAKQAQHPGFTKVRVTAQAIVAKGQLCDADAIAPSVKAFLDGIVLAQVLPDDGPAYVAAVTYLAPKRGPVDELRVTLEAVEDE